MRSVTQNVIMMKLKQQLMKDTRLTAVLLLALLGGTSGYAQDDEDPRKAFEKAEKDLEKARKKAEELQEEVDKIYQ